MDYFIKRLRLKIFSVLVMPFLLLQVFINFGSTYADWQSTLEAQFDIVETFDQLKDWTGSGSGNVSGNPNDMPKKLDGTPSIWQYYSFYGDRYDQNWIGDHGSKNVWRDVGKSLHLDYNCSQGQAIDSGPSRLGFKIGDSPDDGYSDEVHVFFMSRIDKDFFIINSDNTFAYHGFCKTLDISAGFKDIEYFGTVDEHNWLVANSAKSQVLQQYGLNAQVYNYKTYGDGSTNKAVKNTVLTTNSANDVYQANIVDLIDADFGQIALASSWFGLEYRVKMSKPHGSANGEFEVWVYNSAGNIVAHHLETGVVNFRDGNTAFNHGWNKFVWGGNRQCPPVYSEEFGPKDDLYIDDIVVNGSRIGPTYFSLIDDNTTPPPSSPKNARIQTNN